MAISMFDGAFYGGCAGLVVGIIFNRKVKGPIIGVIVTVSAIAMGILCEKSIGFYPAFYTVLGIEIGISAIWLKEVAYEEDTKDKQRVQRRASLEPSIRRTRQVSERINYNQQTN